MKKLILLLAVSAFALVVFDQRAHLVTSQPTVRDIAGRYRLSGTKFGTGVDSIIRSNAPDAYVDLGANGELILHQVPVVPESDRRAFAVSEFRSGSGTFSIAPLGGTHNGEFFGLYLQCGELPDPINTPRLRRKGEQFFLSFDYFDGDFTQRMIFSRTK